MWVRPSNIGLPHTRWCYAGRSDLSCHRRPCARTGAEVRHNLTVRTQLYSAFPTAHELLSDLNPRNNVANGGLPCTTSSQNSPRTALQIGYSSSHPHFPGIQRQSSWEWSYSGPSMPPLHSPVVTPTAHLKRQRSLFDLCSEIYRVTGPVERFVGQFVSRGYVVGASRVPAFPHEAMCG